MQWLWGHLMCLCGYWGQRILLPPSEVSCGRSKSSDIPKYSCLLVSVFFRESGTLGRINCKSIKLRDVAIDFSQDKWKCIELAKRHCTQCQTIGT